MHRAANENKTGKENLRAGGNLPPPHHHHIILLLSTLGGFARGGGLGAGCPDLSASPSRLLPTSLPFQGRLQKRQQNSLYHANNKSKWANSPVGT